MFSNITTFQQVFCSTILSFAVLLAAPAVAEPLDSRFT